MIKSVPINLIYFDIDTGYYPGFHHGIAYLIGSIKNKGYSITLFHLHTIQSLILTRDHLQKQKDDLMCLSFTTNQKKYVHEFLNETNFKKD